MAGGRLCTTNFQRTNVALQNFDLILDFTTYGKEKIKLFIYETANVIKPTISEKNGENHASPTFHNAYLLIKNNVQKLPTVSRDFWTW